MDSCVCNPVTVDGGAHFNAIIGKYFGDCIYTTADHMSFIFAYFGLLCSCLSLAPQLWLNYKLKSVEGLSFYLLLFWTLGDLGSLAGSLLTHQLPPQVVTSATFFIMDFCMCIQYGYYQYLRPYLLGYEVLPSVEEEDVSPPSISSSTLSTAIIGGVGVTAAAILPSANALPILIVEITKTICNAKTIVSPEARYLGVVLSWLSGLFYFTSRIPQVWKNYVSKNVDGLSFYLFFLTILGNLGYGVSVCLRMPQLDGHFWIETFPFLLGSLGVLVFDLFTLIQFYWYQ